MSPQRRGVLADPGNRPVERRNGRDLALPEALQPFGLYVPAVRTGSLVFLSGAGPVRPDGTIVTGRVGTGSDDMSPADARDAARLTGLRLLAALRAEIGDLDRVERVVKLLGFVRCAPEFTEQPAVIDGCSELLVEVLGEAGRGARSAVGVAALPFGIPVEIEAVVQVRTERTT
jgi:enamine deaminase RidA (YjgF/YER057c/UK114 family)